MGLRSIEGVVARMVGVVTRGHVLYGPVSKRKGLVPRVQDGAHVRTDMFKIKGGRHRRGALLTWTDADEFDECDP